MTALVRSRSLTGYRALVRELGGDPQPLLARFQIDEAALEDEEAFISYPDVIRLLQATAADLSCADFGLLLATRQRIPFLGPLALIAQNANTVAEAFTSVNRYLHYYSPVMSFAIEAGDAPHLKAITCAIDVTSCPQRNQVTELTLGIVRNILQTLTGRRIHPDHVLMRHTPSSPERRYREWFGCPVLFGQQVNAVVINADVLARPIEQSKPELKRMAETYIENIIGRRSMDVVGQVSALIERLLGTPTCTLKQIAAHIYLHERTLQSKLMAEGLSFSILLDRIRRQRAEEYLAQKAMPMHQIANLLGYAEQSSFNKSCQRWFGTTPKAVRNEIKSISTL